MSKEQEFRDQLERNDMVTMFELVNNPQWEWLKVFYAAHYDEIEDLVLNCRSLRTVIEDICSLEPALGNRMIENNLFVYQVNLAIKNGMLNKSMLE